MLLLIGAALLVAGLSTGAALLSMAYNISPAWLLAFWVAVIFFLVVGWGYRRKFRDPAFLSLFVAWTLIHVLVYLSLIHI